MCAYIAEINRLSGLCAFPGSVALHYVTETEGVIGKIGKAMAFPMQLEIKGLSDYTWYRTVKRKRQKNERAKPECY
jgi:hypothetical protein